MTERSIEKIIAEARSRWEFFDALLDGPHIVGTPGSGFGACGEGYFRLTSFGSREATAEAAERLQRYMG